MAELALLGLVANIFQFVETGVKIALTAKDVYQGLQATRGALSEDEMAICEYSDECNAIAAELDALAAKFARREGAKSRTIDSVRISWHSHTKKNEVQDLIARLNRMDGRLRVRFEKVLHRQAGFENEDRWSSVMSAIESLDLKTGNMDIASDNLLETAAETLKSQLKTETLVLQLAEEHTVFCFFIDGLDEYKGDETDIISTVAELLSSPNIKLCLSSRPWNRFREAYAVCPGLTLEYLTKADISEYIKSELLSNRCFQRGVDEDPCQRIITQISDQARGVYPWVFLRLLARDPEWLQHLPENIAESQRIAIIRLDDRCKDLLQPRRNEAFPPASIDHFHISLLHRTVRDFFRDNYYGTLREKAGGNFTPEGSIAKCLLWLFKTYPIKLFCSPSLKERGDLPQEKRTLLHNSRKPEDYKMSLVLYRFWSHEMHNGLLIDDKVVESFFDTMITFCGQTWPQLIVTQEFAVYFSPYPADLMLTPWASYLNLEGDLRRNWKPGKANGGHFDYEVLTLLLALEPRYVITSQYTSLVPISPSTVRALLELGCDPRDQKLGLAFLHRFQKVSWDKVYVSNRNVFEVARALFEHGLSVPLIPGPDEEISPARPTSAPYFGPSSASRASPSSPKFGAGGRGRSAGRGGCRGRSGSPADWDKPLKCDKQPKDFK
ncbi:hypothetical protein PG994_004846 [Apiospora phragmitis]|uniref:DUF7791 domain-containing protein n=1 Tax=Apiospora phragmitis TaxID=2905665 RepID=A0ABR1VS01_9PEZI